ncbi:MAG: DUF1684 domain-containing protein [Bacteroidales bacterium]
MKQIKPFFLITALSLVFFYFCGRDSLREEQLKNGFEKWRVNRLERLKDSTGWLTLAGLFWLGQDETNTIGSDTSNSVVFPGNAPGNIGKIVIKGDTISFTPHPGVNVFVNENKTLKTTPLLTDADGSPDKVRTGNLEWYVIKRGKRYGLRLRDYNSSRPERLDTLPLYNFSMHFVVEATFLPHDTPGKYNVPTVIGIDETYSSPGILKFNLQGKDLELIPFESGDKLFILFADETSAETTHGAGRFLYTDLPGREGKVLLDFNLAYNPPCAFTPYATCPLPPRENILPVAIEAGEKDPGWH